MKTDIRFINLSKDIPPNVQRELNALTNEQKLDLIKTAMEVMLTPFQREQFLQYYMVGKTMPELAEEYGVNKSTICRNIHRARRKVVWYIERIHIVKIEIE